ncbi:41 helicase [uncultured Caudovirales phage]|uniref:DnaB-like replicative helicase n=1 Tax=uncultured Caudovirales phage TaxID=2100421 RepID=A0A6J5T886_9CAUD|nr:41 helicase [uncultured Caudovirales phage]
MNLELVILKNLIYNEEYLRKVLPFLKTEYFPNATEKTIFNEILDFTGKYNNSPTTESLKIAVGELNITQDEVDTVNAYIREIEANKSDSTKLEWLIDKTEEFCQEKSIYNAVLGSISILDGADKTHDKGSIPKLLSDALAVSFDNSIGHDYLEESDARYEYYHKKENKIPFDLDYFNKITKGGLSTKTLNVILAGTGVGKSLFMCHVAAGCMAQGKNVLYITMEMAEERIAERIDANLLNVTMDELMVLSKDSYIKKVNRVREKTTGKLIIKEYPTASASSTHFRTLLNELNLKRSFIPDIIFVDYLNICCSARLKAGSNINSYTYVKAIAEELRGLAVEYDVPLVTATQTTRSGFNSSDPGMEDVSESFGLPATADMMFALISSDELEELNQIMVKQLKNRYSDLTYHKRFTIGVDRSKMKLYDTEQSGQSGIIDSGTSPVFSPQKDKKNFEGFKI